MSNWYITPNDNDLMHFGILGMKWGVRRYQNKDGTLTDAGRKRYNVSGNVTLAKQKNKKGLDSAMNEWKTKDAERRAKEREEEIKKLREESIKARKELESVDFLSEKKRPSQINGEYYSFNDQTGRWEKANLSKKEIKRMDDAARLGLEALDYDTNIPKDEYESLRSWFMDEDQTIGCALLADLVNQGKTSGQIKKLIDNAKIVKEISYLDDEDYPSYVFELAESYNPEGFINECIRIKKQKSQ